MVQFTGSMTELINTDSVLNLLNKQFLLKENANLNLINGTFSYTGSADVSTGASTGTNINGNFNVSANKIAQRTLLWNSKRPWNILSTVNYIENDSRSVAKDKSILKFMSSDLTSNNYNSNNYNNKNDGQINGNKVSSSIAHDRNNKKAIVVDSEEISSEVISWNPLIKTTKNKNTEKEKEKEKSIMSTTFLNNITKKTVKPQNATTSSTTSSTSSSTKKPQATTPSAFTSYLQDLME